MWSVGVLQSYFDQQSGWGAVKWGRKMDIAYQPRTGAHQMTHGAASLRFLRCALWMNTTL